MRKAIFTKDYLKDQAVHPFLKHSKFYPWIKPDLYNFTLGPQYFSPTQNRAVTELYFNVIPFALIQKLLEEQS